MCETTQQEQWEAYLEQQLDALASQGNLRQLSPLFSQSKIIPATSGKGMLNLSSNDYLGIGACHELTERFLSECRPDWKALTASSSRLLTGNHPVFEELEDFLARQYHKESALVFGSGYHMNSGILPAVCDSHTLILADKLVHASLIDGIRLSSATCIRYRHQDYRQLASLLEKYHTQYTWICIVTESIFSMDGDTVPLATLCQLKRQYPHVLLYVDEAHAVGVRGPRGLGLAEEQGCMQDIDFLCGTLGKAMGSVGGFIVCSRRTRALLVNKMRPFIFTTAPAPIQMAWTLFVWQQQELLAARRQRLADIRAYWKDALRSSDLIQVSDSQIQPVIIGSNEATQDIAAHMQRQGFYLLPVRPPTVPAGTSRLRLSFRADLSDAEVETLAQELLQELKKKKN